MKFILKVEDIFDISKVGCVLAIGPLCLHAVAITPAGLMELVRSYCPINGGQPTIHGGMAPALHVSRPAQRSLTLRPADSPSRLSDPLHRRLRRLRFLHRRSDCFRVERTQFPGGTFTRSGPAPFHGARAIRMLRQPFLL